MSQLNPSFPHVSRQARRRKQGNGVPKSERRLARMRPDLESLESRRVMAVDPLISEFQATNISTVKDQDGDYSDWIEIRNADVTQVNVAGWYLTDDATDLTKWQFPANTNIAASD